jgi:hypothetical protein
MQVCRLKCLSRLTLGEPCLCAGCKVIVWSVLRCKVPGEVRKIRIPTTRFRGLQARQIQPHYRHTIINTTRCIHARKRILSPSFSSHDRLTLSLILLLLSLTLISPSTSSLKFIPFDRALARNIDARNLQHTVPLVARYFCQLVAFPDLSHPTRCKPYRR